MASIKDCKSVFGKGYKINLTDFKDLNEIDEGWQANYNQRAVLVRILCQARNIKCQLSQANTIEHVKYFTKERDQSEALELQEIDYQCYNSFHQLSLDNFYKFIDNYVNSFEHCNIAGEVWKEVVSFLDLFQYKFKRSEGVEFWSTDKGPKSNNDLKEAFAKMSTEQRKYVSAFVRALRTDMKNGHAKTWIEELIKILCRCLGGDVSMVNGLAPSELDNTNTIMETIFGDLDDTVTQMEFNANPSLSIPSDYSSSSSSQSSLDHESTRDIEADNFLTEVKRRYKRQVVPDYCVTLPEFPGVFPLVFGLIDAYQEPLGLVKNIHQMLSKLFFQDVVFGIVLSSQSFQLSVIIKKNAKLYFASTPCMTFKGIQIPPELDLKELDTMCTFICRVLKWAIKSKCMLAT